MKLSVATASIAGSIVASFILGSITSNNHTVVDINFNWPAAQFSIRDSVGFIKGLKPSDPFAKELRILANLTEGPFQEEKFKVKVIIMDDNIPGSGHAQVCPNSSLYKHVIALFGNISGEPSSRAYTVVAFKTINKSICASERGEVVWINKSSAQEWLGEEENSRQLDDIFAKIVSPGV